MISKAPARVCLFGDHQDYLGLPVIACAINKYIVVEGVPNNTNCLTFNLTDDQPTIPGCKRAALTNSLLHQAPLMLQSIVLSRRNFTLSMKQI